MRVSFIVPAYNEDSTIAEVLERVDALGFDSQIITWRDGFKAVYVLPRIRVGA